MCESRTFTHSRQLVASDFTRFRAYSPLTPSIYFLALQCATSDLSVHGGDDEQLSLHADEPTTPGPEQSEAQPLLELLTHLRRHCPNILNFRLDTLPFAFYAGDPLAAAILSWNHLWSLQALTTPLEANALKHLAFLPSLRLLKANIHLPASALDDALIVQHSTSQSFPALRELVIHADRLETCTRIVEAIHSPTLDDVTALAHDRAPPSAIARLCTALSQHTSLKNLVFGPGLGSRGPASPLRRVFKAPSSSSAPDPPAALAPDDLRPLFSLRALERIVLDGTCYASLDDRAVAELAQAWPHLSTAKLCPGASSRPFATRVTLAGLAPLAALRSVDTVTIALADVDARAIDAAWRTSPPPAEPAGYPSLDRVRDGRKCVCPLQLLGVGRARLRAEDKEAVSAVLSAWFPKLRHTEYLIHSNVHTDRLEWEDLREMDELYWRWSTVGRSVRAFALVREQERCWMAGRSIPR
uniref:Lanosterol 14-alpha-demethylase (EC) n=1 Tax=Ganoderma boninense TaxID=34458 RepID=A0A5K1K5N3_9APHY|nr:Putative lanosterol 14-alpha-demethylase (EC [Ganoderma boninense]